MQAIPNESEKKACPMASTKTDGLRFSNFGLNKKSIPADAPVSVIERTAKIIISKKQRHHDFPDNSIPFWHRNYEKAVKNVNETITNPLL